MYALFTLFAGACQSAMGSLNRMLTDYVGMFGMSLVVHAVGGILLILYMKLYCHDLDFSKKYMLGLALLLKKGLHLNIIHSLNRPFQEMMLGLESHIPLYMTGQISPYYLQSAPNTVFCHFLKVSGSAALSGECIAGCHEDGMYRLSRGKRDLAYYRKRADDLLQKAKPLMDIYRETSQNELNAFLAADSETAGNRRNLLSAPPMF